MISFNIFGHPNILSTHSNTIEFTKDSHLTREGDCIIGIKADFKSDELKNIVKKYSKLKIIIKINTEKEVITAYANKPFDDEHEIVIRKSEFSSKRTLGIRADKAAKDLNKKLIEKLKNPETLAKVEIIGCD
jgi:hypothetical protein